MTNDITLLRALRTSARGLARLMVLIGGSGFTISVFTIFDVPASRVLVSGLSATIAVPYRTFRAVATEANEQLAKAVTAEMAAVQVRSHRVRRSPWSG